MVILHKIKGAPMASHLDEMKDKLREAFDNALSVAAEDFAISQINNRTLAAELVKSAAAAAQAIVAIEREQRESRESKTFPLEGK